MSGWLSLSLASDPSIVLSGRSLNQATEEDYEDEGGETIDEACRCGSATGYHLRPGGGRLDALLRNLPIEAPPPKQG